MAMMTGVWCDPARQDPCVEYSRPRGYEEVVQAISSHPGDVRVH